MHTHTCTRTHSMQHTQLLCHNATHQPANGQARMHAHANIQKHALITFSLYRCCTRCWLTRWHSQALQLCARLTRCRSSIWIVLLLCGKILWTVWRWVWVRLVFAWVICHLSLSAPGCALNFTIHGMYSASVHRVWPELYMRICVHVIYVVHALYLIMCMCFTCWLNNRTHISRTVTYT